MNKKSPPHQSPIGLSRIAIKLERCSYTRANRGGTRRLSTQKHNAGVLPPSAAPTTLKEHFTTISMFHQLLDKRHCMGETPVGF